MLLDAGARKILAQEILNEVLAQRKAAGQGTEIVRMPDGALGLLYEIGWEEPRLGFIYCNYSPISAVEELLLACEQIIEGTSVSDVGEDGSITKIPLNSLAKTLTNY